MFEEARKPSGELVAYDEERKKLIIEFAEKTEDGNLVVSGNNVKIIEDKMEEFTLKVEELNKKHDVDKLQLQLNNQQKEIDELLDETLELDLNSFKEDELESCGIDDVFCLELLFKVGLIE
jgi:transcription antitermination factor NusG